MKQSLWFMQLKKLESNFYPFSRKLKNLRVYYQFLNFYTNSIAEKKFKFYLKNLKIKRGTTWIFRKKQKGDPIKKDTLYKIVPEIW